MIAIVDYGMGNVRSVLNALNFIDEEAVITADAHILDNASRIILPGVGAFGDAMTNLESRNLIDMLHRQVFEKGKPILGICLGMQLFATNSTEHGCHKGLGWFDAEVIQFELKDTSLKIPHMGWNEIEPQVEHPLFAKLNKEHFVFYFVHSFHIVCSNPRNVVATCNYGYPFAAAVFRENLFAVQFHPEKSQDNGLQVLENFVSWEP